VTNPTFQEVMMDDDNMVMFVVEWQRQSLWSKMEVDCKVSSLRIKLPHVIVTVINV
jgi:hypothetical protein